MKVGRGRDRGQGLLALGARGARDRHHEPCTAPWCPPPPVSPVLRPPAHPSTSLLGRSTARTANQGKNNQENTINYLIKPPQQQPCMPNQRPSLVPCTTVTLGGPLPEIMSCRQNGTHNSTICATMVSLMLLRHHTVHQNPTPPAELCGVSTCAALQYSRG